MMSVREASVANRKPVLEEGRSSGQASSGGVRAANGVRAASRVRTAPGVRRRPRVTNQQRPATAPISVRYSQSVTAGCADQQVEYQGYRMGRWARLAVTASVLVGALIMMFSPVLDSSDPVLQPVTVSVGDTVWSIAAAVAPDQDVNFLVEQIIQLNQLNSLDLPVGLVLQIPTDS